MSEHETVARYRHVVRSVSLAIQLLAGELGDEFYQDHHADPMIRSLFECVDEMAGIAIYLQRQADEMERRASELQAVEIESEEW